MILAVESTLQAATSAVGLQKQGIRGDNLCAAWAPKVWRIIATLAIYSGIEALFYMLLESR